MTVPLRLLRVLLAIVLPLALTAPAVHAQVPKVGRDVYEDAVIYGFRMKVPKGWKQVPPQPNERNLLATFTDPGNTFISVGSGQILPIICLLTVFDDRDDDGNARLRTGDPAKRILKWVKERVPFGAAWDLTDDKPKTLRIKGIEHAVSYRLEAHLVDPQHQSDTEVPIEFYVAEFQLEPGITIYFVGGGPGGRKWRSYESIYAKLAKSFARIEVVGVEDRSSGNDTPRDRKRKKLQEEVARSAGWDLYETGNYFIVSDVDDNEFIKELLVRIEAIRKAYEEQYPPEEARAIREKVEEEEEKDGPELGGEIGDGKKKEDDSEGRSVSAIDPLEASRTSVLRVCSGRDTYSRYGGPSGTGGYWNSATEELVIFDDKAIAGRDLTWLVLNHEAFHQYIFYFYGALAPHSWYNEGTGDYYGGYSWARKKFRLDVNRERLDRIRESLRDGEFAPLKDFVRWSQRQYYGTNKLRLSGLQNYAQGWSLIYFLRTGPKKKPRGWQKEWGKILDLYLEALATSGDLDQAIDTAFEGVDWDALEACWKKQYS